jgi:molybdopterin/thiamine biosynthesis adenylyltransferase
MVGPICIKKSKSACSRLRRTGKRDYKKSCDARRGNIFVIDMDNVERSNLTRSVLFRMEDEGKPKAEVAAKRAMEINPDVNIKYFTGNIFNLGLGSF